MIAFVSESKADLPALREVAGLVSQSVVSCGGIPEARRAIRWHHPSIVVCDAKVRNKGDWQELLEETESAQPLMIVVSTHADERLWAEVLNLGGFDVLALPFDRDELRRSLSSALQHSPRLPLRQRPSESGDCVLAGRGCAVQSGGCHVR